MLRGSSENFESSDWLALEEFDTVECIAPEMSCELGSCVIVQDARVRDYEYLAANEGGHSHSQLTVCVYGR